MLCCCAAVVPLQAVIESRGSGFPLDEFQRVAIRILDVGNDDARGFRGDIGASFTGGSRDGVSRGTQAAECRGEIADGKHQGV